MSMAPNALDPSPLRKASMGSNSVVSELGAEDYKPAHQLVEELRAVADMSADADSLLSEPLAAVHHALHHFVQQARKAVLQQADECRALRAELARMGAKPREQSNSVHRAPDLLNVRPLSQERHVRPGSLEVHRGADLLHVRPLSQERHVRPGSREAWGHDDLRGSAEHRLMLPTQIEESVKSVDGGHSPRSTVLTEYMVPPRGQHSRLSPTAQGSRGNHHFFGDEVRSTVRKTLIEIETAEHLDRQSNRSGVSGMPRLSFASGRVEPKEGVFPDADDMKAKVRKYVFSPEYNVSNFYKTEGHAQAIARSNAFEYITLAVIGANAIWIAVDVDGNDATKDPTKASAEFLVMDNLFCSYFFMEFVIRFAAFAEKRDCLKDRWFVFDAFLVILTIIDTWIMSIVFAVSDMSQGPGSFSVLRVFRLLRLTRMARMVRLLRAVPELMILVRGMAAAARSVALTLVLLTGIIYIYAIIFRELTDQTEIGDLYFPSIPSSMSTLLLEATLPDMANILQETGDAHIVLGCIMLSFVLLGTLTVLNMLIGVLVEVVSVVASVEREELSVTAMKSNMEKLLDEVCAHDTDGNNCMSRPEFQRLLSMPEAVKLIKEVGIDVIGLCDYADLLFEGGKELPYTDFFEVLLSLRGNNAATVKDIVDLRKFVHSLVNGEHDSSNVFGSIAPTRRAAAETPGNPLSGKQGATLQPPTTQLSDDNF